MRYKEKSMECMEQRGISPTFIRVFTSKLKGTIAVRVNISAEDFDTYITTTFGQIISIIGNGCQTKLWQ